MPSLAVDGINTTLRADQRLVKFTPARAVANDVTARCLIPADGAHPRITRGVITATVARLPVLSAPYEPLVVLPTNV